jgi:hypothetical protein
MFALRSNVSFEGPTVHLFLHHVRLHLSMLRLILLLLVLLILLLKPVCDAPPSLFFCFVVP